jgi:hypothetical protein
MKKNVMISILTTFIGVCQANTEKSNQINPDYSFNSLETSGPKPFVKLLDVSTKSGAGIVAGATVGGTAAGATVSALAVSTTLVAIIVPIFIILTILLCCGICVGCFCFRKRTAKLAVKNELNESER